MRAGGVRPTSATISLIDRNMMIVMITACVRNTGDRQAWVQTLPTNKERPAC